MPNKVVWKFGIPRNPLSAMLGNVFTMPKGAQLVHVREQLTTDCIGLWFIVDQDETEMITREFQIYGTGHGPIPEDEIYVGSAIFGDGALVLHVFETIAEVVEASTRMKEISGAQS